MFKPFHLAAPCIHRPRFQLFQTFQWFNQFNTDARSSRSIRSTAFLRLRFAALRTGARFKPFMCLYFSS
jgi:hypothetical protein